MTHIYILKKQRDMREIRYKYIPSFSQAITPATDTDIRLGFSVASASIYIYLPPILYVWLRPYLG